jgi:hypothetical protein
MILIALPAICLIHCAKPTSGTALENATGQDVRIEVTYRGADNRTVAEVVAGSDMQLQTPPDQIDAIHYAYPSHACVLTHDQVIAAAHPGQSAKAVVTLKPCG